MDNTQKKKNLFRLPKRKELVYLAMLLPAILITLVFSYLPMSGILLAFKEKFMPRLGIWGSPWVKGNPFKWFVEIFKVPKFSTAIWNTLYINLIGILINAPAPLIFALLLDEVRNSFKKGAVQTISFLPHFLSSAAIISITLSMLSQYGLINNLLEMVGREKITFRSIESAFLPTYYIVGLWTGIGWGSMLYVSALSSVPVELYEAAKIDGAGRFRQVMTISMPCLMPTFAINMIFFIGNIFASSFDLIYGLQSDVWTTEVIATATYKFGLVNGEYEITTALGLLQGVIGLMLTMGTNFVTKKVADVSMW